MGERDPIVDREGSALLLVDIQPGGAQKGLAELRALFVHGEDA